MKINDIELEFDEPFDDVVKGFAIMGYSRRAVASILEINLSYFRQLCSKRGLHKHFKKQKDMRPECRKSGPSKGWPKGKKRPFRPKHSEEFLLACVRQFPNFCDFKTFAPVDASTVSRRFQKPWRAIVAKAKAA
jgi:hypothetical protein